MAEPDLPKEIIEIAAKLALADAMKPLEGPITDVYSHAADKEAARTKLRDAYTVAAGDDGSLRVKFDAAKKSFDRAATDMNSGNDPDNTMLDKWLASAFVDPGKVKDLLAMREELRAELVPQMGSNEKVRADAQAETKKWQARYADWSAPVDRMTAQIGQYAEKIDKLNADINNEVNRNAAMIAFWFEVAPKHLQLAPDLDAEVQKAVDKVADKLKPYPYLNDALIIGAKRTDGSLYFVQTGDEAEQKRIAALEKWKAAAQTQADAEAAFKLRPDDVGTLKQRWDKLKDDAWIAEAKKNP